MTVANIDYEVELLIVAVITLYFQDASWFGHKINKPPEDEEIGYAMILTWIRGSTWVLLTAFWWFYFAETTIAFNAALGGGFLQLLPFICYGMFFLNLVVGIVMLLYLVLPIEKLPKPFRDFYKRSSGAS